MKGYSRIDLIGLGEHAVYNNLAKRKLLLCVLGFCVGTGHVPHVIQAGLQPVTSVVGSQALLYHVTSPVRSLDYVITAQRDRDIVRRQ
jgi:hypothetical protein